MKKVLVRTLFALGLAASAITQAAIINTGPHNGVDVGSVDTFLELRTKADLDSSGLTQPEFELDFINDYADPDVSFSVDDYKIEGVATYSTDEFGVLAFGPADMGDYFIVKNAIFWALFQNVSSTDWGVFNIEYLPSGMNLGDAEISHVTYSPRDGVSVPEPSALLLMTAGLLGLGFAARKKK